MVAISRVLKRKDASSVLIAVVLAMILMQVLQSMTGNLASKLSGMEGETIGAPVFGNDWKATYLFPLVHGVLQVLLLEVFIWVFFKVKDAVVSK